MKTKYALLTLLSIILASVLGLQQTHADELAKSWDLNMEPTNIGVPLLAYRSDPGIWGALLITKAQAKKLNESWAETHNDEGRIEYRKSLKQILTPEQQDIVKTWSLIAEEITKEARATEEKKFLDKARAEMNPEQLANLNSTTEIP